MIRAHPTRRLRAWCFRCGAPMRWRHFPRLPVCRTCQGRMVERPFTAAPSR